MVDTGQHLDLGALSELQAIMGEEFSLLVDTFISDSVVRIEGIKSAVAIGDPEAIRRAAHSFKGSAGNLAAFKLTDLCRCLEEAGFNGVTEGCEQLQNRIIEEYQLVKNSLESL